MPRLRSRLAPRSQRARKTESAYELKKVAEDVLPQIEKFLESPAEKRLRRMRVGTLVSSIGLGTTFAFKVMALLLNDGDILFLAGLGLITFFIGLSFIVNALPFTVPKKSLSDKSGDANSQRELDAQPTSDLVLPASNNIFSSVTEQTTQHLKEKQPIPRG